MEEEDEGGTGGGGGGGGYTAGERERERERVRVRERKKCETKMLPSRLALGLGLLQGSLRKTGAASSSVVLSRVLYSSTSSVVAPLNEPNEVFLKFGNPTPEPHSFAPALGYVPDVKVSENYA